MTATQAPTPGPLSAEDVKLLVKGDLLRVIDPHPGCHKTGDIISVVGTLAVSPTEDWVQVAVDGVTVEQYPSRFAFIGRPDADGWMPWSGGENPVPGQRVEYRMRGQWDEGTYGPDRADECTWSHRGQVWDIIAFRLAPTAPVKASEPIFTPVTGLWKDQSLPRFERVKAHRLEFRSALKQAIEAVDEEASRQSLAALRPQREWSQEQHDREALTVIAEHLRENPAAPYSGRQCEEFVLSARDALRPQPSGETREAVGWITIFKHHLGASSLHEVVKEYIIQHAHPSLGGGEACKGCGHVGPVPQDRVSCCPDGKRYNTLARAEALDEGAAGEPVAWRDPTDMPSIEEGSEKWFIVAVRRKHSERVFTFSAPYLNGVVLEFDEDDDLVERPMTGWASQEYDEDRRIFFPLLSEGDELLAWQEFPKYTAHPSPPPAADKDRVRFADLEATGLNWTLGKGKLRDDEPPYGCQILDGLDVVAEGECVTANSAIEVALAALKSEGK